uniref:Uncharacterized protein n=1 Tax=viral metagenome TaxID=1070528 RepID=A0A6C0LCP8_9ZZZZ
MDEVINQAPDNISKEEIEIIFKKNNEDVINTLVDLWNLDVPKSKVVNVSEASDEANIDLNNPINKWANIRDICDSYDLEMQTHMNRLKNKGK